jgi:hypothetical protein
MAKKVEGHSFIKIDRATKPRIQGNLECFHVTFALTNDFGKLGDLIVDLHLITFQSFQRAVMWQVKEGLSDLVAINLNRSEKKNHQKGFEKVGIQNELVFIGEL